MTFPTKFATASGSALLFAALVAMPFPAHADVKALNACTKSVTREFRKLVSSKSKLLGKCVDAVLKCSEEDTDTEINACIAAKATAAGKPCSTTVLDPGNPATKLGAVIQKFKDKVDGKCKPSDQGGDPDNPTFAELITATLGSSPNANLATGGLSALQIKCDRLQFTTATTAWAGATGLRDCMSRIAGSVADEQVGRSNSRAFSALMRAGVAALTDPVPIGDATLKANIDFRLNFTNFTPGTSYMDITGFTSTYNVSMSGLDEDGVGTFSIDEDEASFTSSTFGPDPYGNTNRLCLEQVGKSLGVLCCNPAGCTAALGSPDYTLNVDHDSSGNNAGFLGTEVSATPDTNCLHTETMTLGDQTFTTSPCRENPARPEACNALNLATGNQFSHHPKCIGGGRNGQPCDPAGVLANECPGATACEARSAGGFTLTQPPCNSAPVLTRTGTWDNGEIGMATVLRGKLHAIAGPAFVDATNYPAGCNNLAGDTKPDSYGCNGIPCDDDDLATVIYTVPYLLTTGTASTTIFDANMTLSSSCPTYAGKISSQNVGFVPTAYCQSDPSVGTVPANACARLSQNNASGYTMVGTYAILDNPAFADGVVSMKLTLVDPLGP